MENFIEKSNWLKDKQHIYQLDESNFNVKHSHFYIFKWYFINMVCYFKLNINIFEVNLIIFETLLKCKKKYIYWHTSNNFYGKFNMYKNVSVCNILIFCFMREQRFYLSFYYLLMENFANFLWKLGNTSKQLASNNFNTKNLITKTYSILNDFF